MTGYTLEAFQRHAVSTIAARFQRVKRVLLQSATGSGKTIMAVDFIRDWMAANPGRNVLCLFNLQCLLPQFEATFKGHGMREEVALFHDLISRASDGTRMVDHQDDARRRVVLTMPETLAGALRGQGNQDLRLSEEWMADVGLILIDEAHKGTSENYQFIRDNVDALVLGLTATPMRVRNKEGECLLNDWEYELVTTVSIRDLIQMGRLVQPLYYDLDEDAHLFREWQRAADQHSREDGNRQTIWFCRNTQHAKEWEAKLLEAGESCAVITSVDDEQLGSTSQTPLQREAIRRDFEARRITHLVSIRALCEGFDAPVAKYCVIDRKVGNRALYQQILGRVLRPYAGKTMGHILDRGGNHARHGDIEDYVWDLEAEAQEAQVVRLGERRTITREDMERATKVMVRCETQGCPSVYNAKNNVSCPHCHTRHGLHVETSAGTWIAHVLPQLPRGMWANFVEQTRRASGGDFQAAVRLMNAYPELFDEDADGLEFRPDIAPVLTQLASIRPRAEKDWKKMVSLAA